MLRSLLLSTLLLATTLLAAGGAVADDHDEWEICWESAPFEPKPCYNPNRGDICLADRPLCVNPFETELA